MNPLTPSSHQKFQKSALVTGFLVLVYLVINLFVLGGDDFVYQLNSFMVIPLSILTSVMGLLLWRQMKDGYQSRRIWGGLMIGWICWMIAELLWAYYSLTGQDPFPSFADLFYLLGYIPLSIGLLSRIRNLPTRLNKSQYAILGSVSLLAGLVTFAYILLPIMQAYDPERLLESILSPFYPLADLFLLLVVLRILFTFGPGNYGMAWRLVLIGFITVTISDLIYSYADWNGLYYPDSSATILSTVGVDWLYSLSYLFWSFGMYVLRVLLGEHEIRRINFEPQLVPNAYVLIFTDRDGRVSGVSQNYHRLFRTKEMMRKTLAELLGISAREESHIQTEFRTKKKLHEEKLCVVDTSGMQYEAQISGLAIMPSPDQYDGAIILLRLYAEDEETGYELNAYHSSLVSNILSKVDNSEKMEISRFLHDYYLTFILSLYNLVLQEGGPPMSLSLLDELRTVSKANGWKFDFQPQKTWDGDPVVHLEMSNHAWQTLLETTKKFTAQLTDTEKVDACIRETRNQLSEAVLKTATRLDNSLSV
jgi:hypothetical protein